MGFQDDWILRQIEIITRYVAQLVFNKTHVEYELPVSDMMTETDLLHIELDRMIREGRIGEAEDLLFESIEFSDRYIELAVDFYSRLNSLTDDELQNAGFSRDEIYEGYIEILTELGVPVEQFLS